MRRLITRVGQRSIVALSILIVACAQSMASTYTTVTVPSQSGGDWSWKDVALVISSISTAVIGISALIISVMNTKSQIQSSNQNATAQRWQDANQKEIEQLEATLRNFHVPYLVRTEANKNMADDLRNRFCDPNYRMLVKLFDPTWLDGLSKGDRALVDEICRTASELREFIEKKGGEIDAGLAEHLARASTHFRILSLAHGGKLGTDPEPFKRYVYPRPLDKAIEADRDRIRRRVATLRAAPGENHGTMEPLKLPKDAQLEPWPNPVRH